MKGKPKKKTKTIVHRDVVIQNCVHAKKKWKKSLLLNFDEKFTNYINCTLKVNKKKIFF